MEDKQTRLDKVKNDLATSGYEAKLTEKTSKSRRLEEQRDELNSEIRKLSLQADSRARLDLKRAEVKTKNADVKNTYVPIAYSAFHGLIAFQLGDC